LISNVVLCVFLSVRGKRSLFCRLYFKLLFFLLFCHLCFTDVFFPPTAVWNTDISNAPIDQNSQSITSWLQQQGGWGTTGLFQIDFSLIINRGGSTAPFYPLKSTSAASGYYLPDCDLVTSFPIPNGAAIEGTSGLQCDKNNNDCHLLVVDSVYNILWESFGSNVTSNGQLDSTCVAVWNLTEVYPASGRGDQCTSADAAGFPIAALMFNPNEVASGAINHAIRFILPNNKIRASIYQHPASHATIPPGGANAPSPAPIYGSRWRLRSNFTLTNPDPNALIITNALQKYGMFLADGGNIPLTAESDQFFTNKWVNLLQQDSHALFGIQPTDFDVIAEVDTPIAFNGNCQRNDAIFPTRPTQGTSSSNVGTITTQNSNTQQGKSNGIILQVSVILMLFLYSIFL